MVFVIVIGSIDMVFEDFFEVLRRLGVRGIFRKFRGFNRGKDRWKIGYLYCFFLIFIECLYVLVLYEKINYGIF